MRLKGKIISWNEEKAFGFIKPNTGGNDVFIHQTALQNKTRTPIVNDIITFTLTKDKQGRNCASLATFSGERLTSDKGLNKSRSNKVQTNQKPSKFSVSIAVFFLIAIIASHFAGYLPKILFFVYIVLSILTFFTYAIDKYKAIKGRWRIPESTLHILALFGGWPGAAIAQQLFRHKSKKREFRQGYWYTVMVNCGGLGWLFSPYGNNVLALNL